MVERNINKKISIDINFLTEAQLKNALTTIREMVSLGVNNYKESTASFTYEFDLRYEMAEEIEFREEVINGKDCIVIPSKMNKS